MGNAIKMFEVHANFLKKFKNKLFLLQNRIQKKNAAEYKWVKFNCYDNQPASQRITQKSNLNGKIMSKKHFSHLHKVFKISFILYLNYF